jgi:hypothetical protein
LQSLAKSSILSINILYERNGLVGHVALGVDATLGEFTCGMLASALRTWIKTGRANLRQSDFESLLDGLEHLLVLLAADEGDTETLGTETTSTTDAMKVRVGITRKIVVDGKVDTLDIDTTTEDVSSDTDTLVELLELLVTLDTG